MSPHDNAFGGSLKMARVEVTEEDLK